VHLLEEELVEGSQVAIRTLDVGHVATVGDEGERTFLEAGDRPLGLGAREHTVALSPHDERRYLQGRETVHQHLALAKGAHPRVRSTVK
jgi:hypothetical protein